VSRVLRRARHIAGHFGLGNEFFRQSFALALTTQNREEKIHQKHKSKQTGPK